MTLTQAQLDDFKKKLLEEKAALEVGLGSVGEKDPHTKGDWVPKVPDYGHDESDPVDVADKIEEMGERVGIESTLEKRLEQVNKALAAIDNGNYGTCAEGGEPHPIPMGRLEANPAATTCVAHAD